MAKNTRKTFAWIVGLLRKNRIPFRISGGLAARVYGSARPLRDIDIEINEGQFGKILPHVKKHVIFGPKRYVDKSFDLLLLTLRRGGQEIDVFGCESQRLFCKKKKAWVKSPASVSCAVRKKILGLVVPVIPKTDLIGYKSIIWREVDQLDLKALGHQSF